MSTTKPISLSPALLLAILLVGAVLILGFTPGGEWLVMLWNHIVYTVTGWVGG